MAHTPPLESIPDDELLANVQRLTARSNVVLADLLAHLGEVEARGIHRMRACASLYTYCIYELRMSEDAAFRRSKAARLVREFPQVGEMIAKGELHLTGLLLIGPHLGGERHAELLERARFRSKREILRLIAVIDPKPEVAARVEPIGPAPRGRATHQAYAESLTGPVRELPPEQRPENWIERDAEADLRDDTLAAEFASELPASAPSPQPEPERSLRYKVQFTANQEYVDLINEAFNLLGHEIRKSDLPDVQLRAMREFVTQLRKRKRAATDRPREPKAEKERGDITPAWEPMACDAPARDCAREAAATQATATTRALAPKKNGTARRGDADRPRHIPAAVRRSVWARDSARCCYVDCRGQRCRETRGLELHHRHAHALGGPPSVDNLELRCTSHNILAAERDFGREYVDWVRGVERSDRGAAPARVVAQSLQRYGPQRPAEV
jgi:hypothetical protein